MREGESFSICKKIAGVSFESLNITEIIQRAITVGGLQNRLTRKRESHLLWCARKLDVEKGNCLGWEESICELLSVECAIPGLSKNASVGTECQARPKRGHVIRLPCPLSTNYTRYDWLNRQGCSLVRESATVPLLDFCTCTKPSQPGPLSLRSLFHSFSRTALCSPPRE